MSSFTVKKQKKERPSTVQQRQNKNNKSPPRPFTAPPIAPFTAPPTAPFPPSTTLSIAPSTALSTAPLNNNEIYKIIIKKILEKEIKIMNEIDNNIYNINNIPIWEKKTVGNEKKTEGNEKKTEGNIFKNSLRIIISSLPYSSLFTDNDKDIETPENIFSKINKNEIRYNFLIMDPDNIVDMTDEKVDICTEKILKEDINNDTLDFVNSKIHNILKKINSITSTPDTNGRINVIPKNKLFASDIFTDTINFEIKPYSESGGSRKTKQISKKHKKHKTEKKKN